MWALQKTTYAARVKGQRVGTPLGSRPEWQAVIAHLEKEAKQKTFFYLGQLGAAQVMIELQFLENSNHVNELPLSPPV